MDIGPLLESFQEYWELLIYKGYLDAAEFICTIYPLKRPLFRQLKLEKTLTIIYFAIYRNNL